MKNKNATKNEYGLREFSFDVDYCYDDGDSCTANVIVVGDTYHTIGDDEIFYRKEDVDSLLAKKDKELDAYKKELNLLKQCN